MPFRNGIPHPLAFLLNLSQHRRLVKTNGLSVIQQHLTIDKDGLHICSVPALNQGSNWVVHRAIVYLEQIDDNNVRLGTDSEPSNVVTSKMSRSTQCCRVEDVSRFPECEALVCHSGHHRRPAHLVDNVLGISVRSNRDTYSGVSIAGE